MKLYEIAKHVYKHRDGWGFRFIIHKTCTGRKNSEMLECPTGMFVCDLHKCDDIICHCDDTILALEILGAEFKK